MVTMMRTAMRIACGAQYTDRQTNIQTDQHLSHLDINRVSSVTRTRVFGFIDVVGERGHFVPRSEVTA